MLPVVDNFIAGKTENTAVKRAESLEEDGITAIINLLGEHYELEAPAVQDKNAYFRLINKISEQNVNAEISVKPSQIGLDIDAELFEENARAIVEEAVNNNVFVWFDMEDSSTTDETIAVYNRLVDDYPGMVGVCLQANLRRTIDDLEDIYENNDESKVRLVKGAYSEDEEIAYTDDVDIDRNYEELIETAFELYDSTVGVGTHDERMITLAKEKADSSDAELEVQMLMGVREEMQRELVDEGVAVSQYVPYGGKWVSYVYRRIREKKGHAKFMLRALLGD